jgi:hypothetical protein
MQDDETTHPCLLGVRDPDPRVRTVQDLTHVHSCYLVRLHYFLCGRCVRVPDSRRLQCDSAVAAWCGHFRHLSLGSYHLIRVTPTFHKLLCESGK